MISFFFFSFEITKKRNATVWLSFFAESIKNPQQNTLAMNKLSIGKGKRSVNSA